jgi:hypothetical protein
VLGGVVLVTAAVWGFADNPRAGTVRSDRGDCTGEHIVYAPPRQGPDESERASVEAFECFESARLSGEPTEIDFILLGTEGEHYRANLRSTGDGEVDYERENDWGREVYRGCADYEMVDPGIPEVGRCER